MSSDPSPVAIETRALSKTFAKRTVIKDIGLSVPKGTIYGFLGQNGAGKTTTMRMLLGLIKPSSGALDLLGTTLYKDGRQFTKSRIQVSKRIGALVEGPAFYPFLSGYKNLSLFAELLGVRDKKKVEEYLDAVGLLERSQDLFRVYSRGMKQRLAIAAALIHDPELVLLDEPMNGLDPPGVIRIRNLLLERAQNGTTIFLSSHLLNDAEQFCSHVGILHEGLLVAQGLLEDLCRSAESMVDLTVDDMAKTLEILDKHESVSSHDDPELLKVTANVKTEDIAQLNKALVEGGIQVSALVPRKRTLENVFLTETQGVAS
ncbi:MAG: ABC transporter ATP-binding protein [Planctomycetota bacterium]|nr:ABC transporter ATP-binding protein [Planctomycetota bacterium]